jgi:hypothetical protein
MLLTAQLGSPVLVAALLILTGSGGSIAMLQVTSVVLASMPSEQAGTASAVFNTFRQVGGAVAIAVFGALIADRGNFVHDCRPASSSPRPSSSSPPSQPSSSTRRPQQRVKCRARCTRAMTLVRSALT